MTDAIKFAPPFEGFDADLVLEMFWISFKSWEKMNVDQRSKTLTFGNQILLKLLGIKYY
jgi:hypothetical protein